MFKCIHTHTRTHTHTHIYIYMYIHTSIPGPMYTLMHVQAYSYRLGLRISLTSCTHTHSPILAVSVFHSVGSPELSYSWSPCIMERAACVCVHRSVSRYGPNNAKFSLTTITLLSSFAANVLSALLGGSITLSCANKTYSHSSHKMALGFVLSTSRICPPRHRCIAYPSQGHSDTRTDSIFTPDRALVRCVHSESTISTMPSTWCVFMTVHPAVIKAGRYFFQNRSGVQHQRRAGGASQHADTAQSSTKTGMCNFWCSNTFASFRPFWRGVEWGMIFFTSSSPIALLTAWVF